MAAINSRPTSQLKRLSEPTPAISAIGHPHGSHMTAIAKARRRLNQLFTAVAIGNCDPHYPTNADHGDDQVKDRLNLSSQIQDEPGSQRHQSI